MPANHPALAGSRWRPVRTTATSVAPVPAPVVLLLRAANGSSLRVDVLRCGLLNRSKKSLMRLGDFGPLRIMVAWPDGLLLRWAARKRGCRERFGNHGLLSQPGEHVQRLLSQRTNSIRASARGECKPSAASRLHADGFPPRRATIQTLMIRAWPRPSSGRRGLRAKSVFGPR